MTTAATTRRTRTAPSQTDGEYFRVYDSRGKVLHDVLPGKLARSAKRYWDRLQRCRKSGNLASLVPVKIVEVK